jgi:hypothetical protein
MKSVGWVIDLGADGLMFPNFAENNRPSKSRPSVAKSDAERAREYRARKNAKSTDHDPAQPSRHVTTDKRREDKSKELSTSLSLNNALELREPLPPIKQPKPERERVLGEGAELNHWQQLMKKVNGLKPAWGKPAHWNASEMHLLYGGSGAQMLEMTEEDWTMLTGYLRAPMNPDQKEFWLPRTRIKFVETFPQVLESADRWAKKHQPKSAETDDIYH